MAETEVDYNGKAVKPANPTKTGYTFAGWYSDADLTTAYDFETAVTDDVTIYAKWTINKYNVTFKDGDTTLSEAEVEYGGKVEQPANPTKSGYNFAGWFADAEFTVAFDFESSTVTDNLTIYAKFTAKSNGSGGSSAVKPEPTPEPTPEPNKCDGGKDCVSHGYDDVNTSAWYHDAVDYAVSHNLFKGNSETEFAPNGAMTRGMLVTVLARYEEARGGKVDANQNTFTDVAAGSWYEMGAAWAAGAGIVNGVTADSFAPNDNISREQLVAMLYRYADYLQLNTEVPDKALSFNDSESISDYAVDAVKWAVANGIINGKDNNNFDPSGSASRAEVAAVLMRFAEFAETGK